MQIAVPGAHVTVKSLALPTDPLWVTTGDFETDWALVDNTAVAKARSADVAALKVHFVGIRPADATLAAAIKGLPLDAAELALLGEIDAELRLRGLRFHHVFFAMPRTGGIGCDATKSDLEDKMVCDSSEKARHT